MRERERERERKREKERERERERERVRCQMIWLTAGNRAPQVEFFSSVLPVLWMCITVFAWFTPSLVDCRVWSQVLALGGPIALQCFVDISDKKLLHTKVVFNVFNHFDRDSYVCICVSIFKHAWTLLSLITVLTHIELHRLRQLYHCSPPLAPVRLCFSLGALWIGLTT